MKMSSQCREVTGDIHAAGEVGRGAMLTMSRSLAGRLQREVEVLRRAS